MPFSETCTSPFGTLRPKSGSQIWSAIHVRVQAPDKTYRVVTS
jgi:hypothetical protein